MANDLTDSSGTDVGVNAWSAAETSLLNFIRDPDMAGLQVGLSYFPTVNGCESTFYCSINTFFGSTPCSNCSSFGCSSAVAEPWPYQSAVLTSGVNGDCKDNTTTTVPAEGNQDSTNYEYFYSEPSAPPCRLHRAHYAPTYVPSSPSTLNTNQGVDSGTIPGSGTTPFWETLSSRSIASFQIRRYSVRSSPPFRGWSTTRRRTRPRTPPTRPSWCSFQRGSRHGVAT